MNTNSYFTNHPLNQDAEQVIREEIAFILQHESYDEDNLDAFNNIGCEFDEEVDQ
jgi:hypothetical protein